MLDSTVPIRIRTAQPEVRPIAHAVRARLDNSGALLFSICEILDDLTLRSSPQSAAQVNVPVSRLIDRLISPGKTTYNRMREPIRQVIDEPQPGAMDLHGKVPVRCPIDENHPSRCQCGPQPRPHDLPLVREQMFVDSAKHDETKCPIPCGSSLPEGEQRNFTLPRERNALMRFAISIFSGLSSTPVASTNISFIINRLQTHFNFVQ